MTKQEEIKRLIQEKVNQVVVYEDKNNAIESGFDPEECSECHLPGDCPLCGGS